MRKFFKLNWLTLSFGIICCIFMTSCSKTETKEVKEDAEVVDTNDEDFITDTPEVAEVEDYYMDPFSMFFVALSGEIYAGLPDDIEETEEEKEENKKTLTYQDLEKKPVFMGSDVTTFSNWVKSNIVYPDYAIENSIQGRVVVQFIVGRDGSVSDVEIVNDADCSLGDEVTRVVRSSPKWTPASHLGENVRVMFKFPVEFRLE